MNLIYLYLQPYFFIYVDCKPLSTEEYHCGAKNSQVGTSGKGPHLVLPNMNFQPCPDSASFSPNAKIGRATCKMKWADLVLALNT